MNDQPNHPVLHARTEQATAPVPTTARETLDVEVQRAQFIARAKDALPPSYRENTGAVLLAMGWAQAHDIDLLTTIQTVAFIHGRPVVDATMQRALAAKAGHKVRVVHADPESATVEVDGQPATYHWQDAVTAGLTGKDNWKKNPEDMLVARATTRAIKRFAPEVMVGLAIEDEIPDAQDSVAQLESALPVGGSPPPIETAVTEEPPAPEPVTEVEVVDVTVAIDREVLETELRELYKAVDRSTAAAFKDWRSGQELPVRFSDMTDEDLLRAADWFEERQ